MDVDRLCHGMARSMSCHAIFDVSSSNVDNSPSYRSLSEAIRILGFNKLRLTLSMSDNESSGVEVDKSVIMEDVEEETEVRSGQGFGRKRGPKGRADENISLKSKTRMGKIKFSSSPMKTPRNNEAVMACKICPNTSFRGQNEFESHLAMEHFVAELVSEYGVRKSKACILCEETFVSVQKLARHIGSEHHKVIPFYDNKVDDLAEKVASKYGSADHQCSFCKIKFRNKKLLGTHIGAVHEKFGEFMINEDSKSHLELEVTL